MFTSYHYWVNAVRSYDPLYCIHSDYAICLRFEGRVLAVAYAAGEELEALGGRMTHVIYDDRADETFLIINEPDFAEALESWSAQA